jgi:hypothetical protein
MKDAAIRAANAEHDASLAQYEVMTFKELVRQMIDHSFDGVMPPDDWVDMLRRVAVREASVGHVSINPAGPNGVPALDGLCMTKKLLAGWNDYNLVPKETP